MGEKRRRAFQIGFVAAIGICAAYLLYAHWTNIVYIRPLGLVDPRGVRIVGLGGSPLGPVDREGFVRVPCLEPAAAAELRRLDWRPCDYDEDEVNFWREDIKVGWDRIEVNIPLIWDSPDRVPAAELIKVPAWGHPARAVFHDTEGESFTKLLIVAHVLELRSKYQNPHIEYPRDTYLYDIACTRVLAAKYGLAWDSWLSGQDAADLLPTTRRLQE